MNSRLNLFAAVFTSLSFYSIIAVAQDQTDALRYSLLSPQATARSMGFGGALGSIGGDFASLSVNPAGIGVYRSSEFMFTPSLKFNNASSKYQGQTTQDNNTRFTINNLGVVFTSAAKGRRYERSKWKSVSFGLGINRIADFNQTYSYGGFNNTSSGAEVFSADANAYPGDIQNTGTLAGLGYQSYLLDFNGTDSLFFPVINYKNGVNQSRLVKERGGITDIAISLGGNYEEKLMIGGTLGIPSLYYTRDVTYTETDPTGNSNNNFDNFSFKDSKTTRGSGINLKLGFIYKINDNIRVGASIHTPTYFQLKDITNMSITTNTENFKPTGGPITTISSPESYFEYNLLTPWRAVLSASAVMGRYGFITADYEFVDYSSARFSMEQTYSEFENRLNRAIKSNYKGASNFRVGAEGRLDNFSIRLGFGYYGSPAVNATDIDNTINLSAGVGYREQSWYVDLGFVNSNIQRQENPYVLEYAPPIGTIAPIAKVKQSVNNMAITVGFKF